MMKSCSIGRIKYIHSEYSRLAIRAMVVRMRGHIFHCRHGVGFAKN
jgi:hypothetical protein